MVYRVKRSKKTTALTKARLTFKEQPSVVSINALTVEWSVRKPDGNSREVCFRLDNDIADHKQILTRNQTNIFRVNSSLTTQMFTKKV